MQSGQTVLYTGNFSIEQMNAAGKRVFANATVMRSLGYHMVMVGVDLDDSGSTDILATGSLRDGIEIYHYPGALFHKSRSNYLAFFAQLKRLLEERRWDVKAVIGYNSPSLALFIGLVQSYCRARGIKYITDVADWLTVDANNPLFRVLRQADITLKNAYYSNKSDGVIAISTWLADYYRKRVQYVTVVPPLSLDRRKGSGSRPEIPQVVYAGLPFRKGAVMGDPSAMKDRFDVACDLLRRAAERGADFRFHVFGFTREEFLYSIPMLADSLEVLGDRIVFHGMKPMEEVQAAVSEADYTILIREKNRVTTAGFPTKVSESITCGTPVITTRTSDIDKYLQEGRGAFFFDLEDSEAAEEKLIELLRKNVTERSKQKAECDRIEAFDPSTYLDKIRSFLCEVLGQASEAGEKRRKDGGS